MERLGLEHAVELSRLHLQSSELSWEGLVKCFVLHHRVSAWLEGEEVAEDRLST